MKTITLKEFKQRLLNNKVHFLGSAGFNSTLDKVIEAIDRNVSNGFKFEYTATITGKNNILYRHYEDTKSRIDLNGKVYIHNGVHILHGNDNAIMIYAIENN